MACIYQLHSHGGPKNLILTSHIIYPIIVTHYLEDFILGNNQSSRIWMIWGIPHDFLLITIFIVPLHFCTYKTAKGSMSVCFVFYCLYVIGKPYYISSYGGMILHSYRGTIPKSLSMYEIQMFFFLLWKEIASLSVNLSLN